MNRIIELIATLRRRGIHGQITEEQAIDALRSLPDPARHPVPKGFDDSKDYLTELLLLNQQHPEILNLKPRILTPRPKRTGRVKINPKTLASDAFMLDINAFKNYFSNQIHDDRVAIANLVSATGQVLRIRVQALICRNSDGKLTSGSAGQTKEQMAPAIDKIIDAVNEIYSGTGIEFIFYPSADIDIRYDTKLNQDFILAASEQPKLYLGKRTPQELEDLMNQYSTDSYRAQVCAQYPQKLVLLFAEGTTIGAAPYQGNWRRCKKCESLIYGDDQSTSHCASGGHHDADLNSSYIVYIFGSDGFSTDPTNADLQKGWRWCKKCQSLFFNAANSHCPAGGQHDGSESAFYVLDYISSFTESVGQVVDNKSQTGWRWCSKCQGLFLGKNQALSNCPAGDKHTLAGSADYVMLSEASTPRQIVMSPSGGGFSSENMAYAKLSAEVDLASPGIESYATFAAHEMGHYLSLWHPFVQFSVPGAMTNNTVQEKIDYLKGEIRKYLEKEIADKNVTRQNVTDALDGDKGSEISDTPADDSGELIHYLNVAANASSDACGPIGTCHIPMSDGTTVSYSPDRSLVMSYFKGCMNFDQHFSADQTVRMRKHLINGFRRPLVSVQLGDTATPAERVCAVWSPNTQGQAYVTGYSLNDFKKKCEDMNKANFRLTQQQAYTRNGATLYDGIFNPGTVAESKVWGWTVQDFINKDKELTKTQWRLIHLESYLLPNGQVRVNGIWNQNNFATSWVQGFSLNELDKKIKDWKKQGWQPVQINGWQLTGNEARYDAIARPINVDYPYFLGWSEADFQKLYSDMWGKKYKLSVLDAIRVSDGTFRYNGVFIPDAQTQFVTWNATREQVRQYYDEMWAMGMKLRWMNNLSL